MYVLVSMLDKASGAFATPVVFRSLALAERSFRDEVNRESPENAAFHHPEDFSLHHVGTFEEADGTLTPANPPVCFAQGKDLKNPS